MGFRVASSWIGLEAGRAGDCGIGNGDAGILHLHRATIPYALPPFSSTSDAPVVQCIERGGLHFSVQKQAEEPGFTQSNQVTESRIVFEFISYLFPHTHLYSGLAICFALCTGVQHRSVSRLCAYFARLALIVDLCVSLLSTEADSYGLILDLLA